MRHSKFHLGMLVADVGVGQGFGLHQFKAALG